VNYARQSFVLMKETRNLPLDFQVEALIISRQNILEQLMRVPRRGWRLLIRDDPLWEGASSRLSKMIHFGKAYVTSKVLDLFFANFHQRRSSFLMEKSAIKRRITPLCKRKTFSVQLRWFITLEVDRTVMIMVYERQS